MRREARGKQLSEAHKKYSAVNGQWPEAIPALRPDEALAAAKRLYRFAMKRAYPGKWKLASGNRFTWQRSHVFYVNPNRSNAEQPGWHDLVHMISHYCHRRLHPRSKPHDARHHFLEKEMVGYVIAQGWLDGRLHKPAPKRDPSNERRERTLAGIARWEAKQKRAETALKKLRRRAAYYEKRT